MPGRRVRLLPDIRVDIAQDAQFCAYQTAGVVVRIPGLQHNLLHLAAADLCEDPRSEEAQAARRRIETLKGEIAQSISNTGRCQFRFPSTERLLGQINQATRDRHCDMAYQISRDLIPAVFADLAQEEFKSAVEKQMEAAAQAQAEAAQREADMAVWRREVYRARAEKRPEPSVPARWRIYYTIEEEEAPRKRGRPKGAAPLSRRAESEA